MLRASLRRMVFLCQSQPYLKSTNLKALSCVESKKFKDSFEVEFSEALIFPEGGGQPSDHGVLKNSEGQEVAKITNAYRKGEQAISILDKQIDLGQDYSLELDFQRRFDHMQQHTGQHLLSAIAEKAPFNMDTTSWWLGTDMCNVEFDAKTVSEADLLKLETLCNQAIREAADDVQVHVTDKAGAEALGAKTRGLPDDHVGDLRVVQLPGGIDMNLCCGTHLKNLRELQACKLLSVEKGKKGKCLVNFAFGGRVLKLLDFAHNHQAGLTKVLKCGPQDQIQKATTLVSKMTLAERGLKNSLMDLAKLEAQKFNESNAAAGNSPGKKLVLDRHNKDGSMDFLIVMGNQLEKGSSAFITIGDEKVKGNTFGFVCLSPHVEEISAEVLKVIEGKGNAKNGKMQGKCMNLKKRKEVIKLLEGALAKAE